MLYNGLHDTAILTRATVELCGHRALSIHCLPIEMLRRVRLPTFIAGTQTTLGDIYGLRSRQHMGSLLYSLDWDRLRVNQTMA
jgi:hypothetical protein